MRSSVDSTYSFESEQDNCLNGVASQHINVTRIKKSQNSVSFTNHFNDNKAIYFLLTAIMIAGFMIIRIEQQYKTNSKRGQSVDSQWSNGRIDQSDRKKHHQDINTQDKAEQITTFNSPQQRKTQLTQFQNLNNHNKFDVQNNKKQNQQTSLSEQKQTLFSLFTQKQDTKSQNIHWLTVPRGRPIAGIKREHLPTVSRWLKIKNEDLNSNSQLVNEQKNYYQQKYNVSQYQELPFCIVIPSYNNVKNNRHINNIKSVVMQQYSNYRIVFIDDASKDGTGDQVQQYLNNQNKLSRDKYVVIKNLQQHRAMPNLRKAARQFCKPLEIFMIVDGDDELLGRQVLKLFNSVFQKEKSWFVYTNFLNTRGTVGYSRPFPNSVITNNRYRYYPFVTSHLRAFYTQLFLNIKQEDLLDKSGNYLKAANDVAICIPILQMAHQRVKYVPQLTYFYNSNTGQNNHHLRLRQQKGNDKMLRKRKSYARLDQLLPLNHRLLYQTDKLSSEVQDSDQKLYFQQP